MLAALFIPAFVVGVAAVTIWRIQSATRTIGTFKRLLTSGKPEDLRTATILFAGIVIGVVIYSMSGTIGFLIYLFILCGIGYAKKAGQQKQPNRGQQPRFVTSDAQEDLRTPSAGQASNSELHEQNPGPIGDVVDRESPWADIPHP